MPGDGESTDILRYDVMVETALRGVVRDALGLVAAHGLPGEHHFYVTFRTGHPDVVMPDHLRERYPREMTIVLQFQFWELEVGEDAFAVTLTFNNVSERLTVPFEAVVAFADPSVRFGLQFEAGEDEVAGEPGPVTEAPSNRDGDGPPAGGDAEEGDNVVTLDQFRRE